MMRTLPLLAGAFAIAQLFASRSANADPTFGLSFSIASIASSARDGGARVADDAWVQAQIDDANHFFAPLGTRFRWTIEKELPEPHGEPHSRADRDALTPLTEENMIDVFLVRALEDVDEPGRFRKGVCWTGRGGKRFIILSRVAPPTVLAHELGHYFGNRQHSSVVDNLMSYARSGGTLFFDEAQMATVKSTTLRFLETRRLLDVGPPLRHF